MSMKFLLLAMALFIAPINAVSTTYTNHYNLAKPNDGSTTWGSDLRDNFDTIDTQMYVANTTIGDHIADPTGAHAATAVSTTVGPFVCTASTNVQAFLTCLDTEISIVTGIPGQIMTTNTTQTVTGLKTFSVLLEASGGLTASSLSVGGGSILSGGLTLTGGSNLSGGLTLSGSATISDLSTGVVHSDLNGVLSSSEIVNADVSATADIAVTKIADGTANQIIGANAAGDDNEFKTINGTSNQISVSHGAGLITLSTPQNIATTSSPTFNDITIDGAAYFENTTGITKVAISNSKLDLRWGSELQFFDDSNAQTIGISSPTAVTSYDLDLPVAQGASQEVMQNNGSGALSWTNPKKLTTNFKTTTYTATTDDQMIMVDGQAGAWTLTLYTAVGNTGRILDIVRTDQTLANLVTIDGDGAETIGGYSSRTLATQRESTRLISDGTNWQILEHYIPGEWNSFTPTGSWVANTTYTGMWRRSGDSIDLQYVLNLSGAPTATSLTLNLVSGLTMDNTKFIGAVYGTGAYVDAGSTLFRGGVDTLSATTFACSVGESSSTYLRATVVTQTVPFTFGNTDQVFVILNSVPIAGWDG